jgi:hypothetical protein
MDNRIFFYSFFDKHAGDYIANKVWREEAYELMRGFSDDEFVELSHKKGLKIFYMEHR